jgi:hypothetical protein
MYSSWFLPTSVEGFEFQKENLTIFMWTKDELVPNPSIRFDSTPKKIYFSYGKNPASVKFSNILTWTENSFIRSR